MIEQIGRAIGMIAALVGLGTSLASVAGGLDWDAVEDALQVAGVAFAIAASVTSLVQVARDRTAALPARLMWASGALVVLVGALGWGVRGEERQVFVIWGWVAVAIGLLYVVHYGFERRSAYRAAHMECPDCAETIKRRARVCRHCGYRFAPPVDLPSG